MGIADLFRPNWKHSKASVREAAIRQLGEDDLDTLLEIAETDPEPSLRALALERIEDPAALEAFAGRTGEAAVAQAAQARADVLWMAAATQPDDADEARAALERICGEDALANVVARSPIESIRRLALERMTDPRALADLAKTVRDRAIAVEVVGRIRDSDTLRGIAIAEQRREVAQAALDRIEDDESLQQIAQRARVKAIRTRARRKRNEHAQSGDAKSATALQDKKIHAQLVQILREVERLSASTDWERASAELERLHAEWTRLQQGWSRVDEKLVERYETFRKGFALRREQAEALRKERAQAEATEATERFDPDALPEELQEDYAARVRLLDRLAALDPAEAHKQMNVFVAEWDAFGPIPRAYRDELSAKWDALRKQVRKAIREQATQAAAQATQVDPAKREAAFEEVLAAAEEALSQEKLKQARKAFAEQRTAWRKLEKTLGRDAPLAGRFEALEVRLRQWEQDERAARAQEQEENLRRIQGLLERAEAATSLDSIAKLDRVLRQVRATLKKPGQVPTKSQWNELRPRLQAARDALVMHRRALEDTEEWKRWSNTAQQEKLIAEAEALLEVDDLAEVARRLKQCQARWKKLGPGSREKGDALWNRFKETCDKVHARCEVYFLEQDKKRQENLEKKLTLCERVEALQDSEDWGETAEAIKALQAEWKQIGPVPRKHSDAIWRRFRAACDHFFERRKAAMKEMDKDRAANLEKKTALCERAEALQDSTDWDETAEALKALQAEWKQIGPVPRKHSDAIWRRFRAACDHFFERRADYQDEGRTQNLSRRKALLESLTSLLDAPATPPEELARSFLDAWSEWSTLQPVPGAEDAPTRARFLELIARALERHGTAFLGSPLDPMMTQQKMVSLCEKAESLRQEAEQALSGSADSSDPIDTQDAEAMAARLQEALASGAFRKEQEQEAVQRIGDQAAQIRRTWDRLPPLPGEEGKALGERFETAYQVVARLLPRPQSPRDGDRRRTGGRGRRDRSRASRGRSPSRGRTRDRDKAPAAKPKANAKPEPEQKAGAEPEPEPEQKAGAKPEPAAEQKAGAKPKPEPEPEQKAGAKPEPEKEASDKLQDKPATSE